MAETTTTSGAPRGRPGYSREQVVSAAVAEFNAHGYDATSMGALAKRLGITKSAIYHHVQSKEQILQEATNVALDGLENVLAEAAELEGGAGIRLRWLIQGSVLVLCERRPEVTLLLRLRGNSDIELAALERRRKLTRNMADLLASAQAEGAVRDDLDAGFVGRIVFGAVNSISDWYEPGGKFTPDEIAKMTLNLVFGGIQK